MANKDVTVKYSGNSVDNNISKRVRIATEIRNSKNNIKVKLISYINGRYVSESIFNTVNFTDEDELISFLSKIQGRQIKNTLVKISEHCYELTLKHTNKLTSKTVVEIQK